MRFKLLAIRPLKNCDARFLKNLKEGKIYQFYNGYIFNTDGRGEVISIENKSSVPENLYDLNSKLKVNISAIVGKNGSGKSTLVELFIACINKLSFKLKKQKKLNTEADIKDIKKINCEVYYEIKNEVYCLSIRGDEVSLKNISTNINVDLGQTILQDFFYSIVVNYSLYAFNSSEAGKYWIQDLFHKNDAYQVPIVLNPYRNFGNIDINSENHLVKQRLLSIIISEPNYPISDNLLTEYIKIGYKEPKYFYYIINDEYQIDKILEENDIELKESDFYDVINNLNFSIHFHRGKKIINNGGEILKKIKKNFNIEALPEELKYRIDNYILYKIISICSVYIEYRRFLKQKSGEDTFYQIDIDGFLNKFENSDSHILFKLKQVVNFVKNYDKVWKDFIEKSNELPIKELSSKLKEIKGKNSIIDLLPPPIYDVNFFTKDNIDILGSISSGEKQLIYSVSTILYHIINLNSVDKSDMCKYRYINIILDEIELYFHPEYQRRFISHLLDSIKNLNITNIEAINILFLTHSPFILSDIPSENTLRLENGNIMAEQNSNNSFAANIHDLLADEFFLSEEGFMGEFAKKKIQSLIKFLEGKEEWNKENALDFINMIGEPMLRETLRELYFEKYNDAIDIEIKRLQELKNRQK